MIVSRGEIVATSSSITSADTDESIFKSFF
jgi:hypothetical protein